MSQVQSVSLRSSQMSMKDGVCPANPHMHSLQPDPGGHPKARAGQALGLLHSHYMVLSAKPRTRISLRMKPLTP